MMITVSGRRVGAGISVAFGTRLPRLEGPAWLVWDGTTMGRDWMGWEVGFVCLGFARLVLYYTTKRAVWGLRTRCEDREFLVDEAMISVGQSAYLV